MCVCVRRSVGVLGPTARPPKIPFCFCSLLWCSLFVWPSGVFSAFSALLLDCFSPCSGFLLECFLLFMAVFWSVSCFFLAMYWIILRLSCLLLGCSCGALVAPEEHGQPSNAKSLSLELHCEKPGGGHQLAPPTRMYLAGTPAATSCCGRAMAYPDGVGFLVGDFNICDPAEGMLNSRSQTFSDGDTSRAAALLAAFRRTVEIAQPFFTREDVRRDRSIQTLSRVVRALVVHPMAELRDFRSIPER